MSEDNSRNHDSSATHQRLQHSTTLNRRYVTRPEPMIQQEAAEIPVRRESVKCAEQMEHTESAETMKRAESTETAKAVAISSFAKCQAENLRRRQELAEKINQERVAAMKSKQVRRGYVAMDSQNEQRDSAAVAEPAAKPVRVVTIDDEPREEEDWETEEEIEEMILPAQELPMQRAANERLAQTWPETKVAKQATAQELKDEAIRKAMRAVATMEAAEQKAEQKKQRKHASRRMRMGNRKRIALAVACALAVVGGIGYFVVTNMPSVSYGAMAMQSGIDLSGMWVPRDFNLVTSSAGEGSLNVIYAKGDTQFSLTAELSTWDSQTLLSNFVETNWRGYDVVKEQGKTIYISNSNAAWVSGGVRYILEAKSGALTNKQIKTIAASL